MKVIQTSSAPAAIGPYSQGIITGNLIFTAGQIPITAGTGEVSGTNITEQTEQVAKNLKAILEAAGSSMVGIVKATCYLADMNDFAAFNEVYAKHFPGKPARTTIAAKTLPRNVLVEIDVIAELG
jgi:2-iminobutanoate/2-iminopropanoate deaminase